MNCELQELSSYVQETVEGQCTIVAALVIAPEESGALPPDGYRKNLLRLWRAMPEQEAVGEAGAVIERVLDLLAAQGSAGPSPDAAAPAPEEPVQPQNPVNDNAEPHPLGTLVRVPCSAARRGK